MRRLTPLQAEVLELVLQGKSNRQIADELVEDEDTIKHRVKRALSKFGVSKRSHLLPIYAQVKAAIENNRH